MCRILSLLLFRTWLSLEGGGSLMWRLPSVLKYELYNMFLKKIVDWESVPKTNAFINIFFFWINLGCGRSRIKVCFFLVLIEIFNLQICLF
jgi:hypothetical protein